MNILFLNHNIKGKGKNGHEFLQEIKADNEFKHIPVIIFTSSNANEDIKCLKISSGNNYIYGE